MARTTFVVSIMVVSIYVIAHFPPSVGRSFVRRQFFFYIFDISSRISRIGLKLGARHLGT